MPMISGISGFSYARRLNCSAFGHEIQCGVNALIVLPAEVITVTGLASTGILRLSKQLGVAYESYQRYKFEGRTINHHRQRIRQRFGFRPYAASDGRPIVQWLSDKILPSHQQSEALEQIVINDLRANRIEPPSPAQIQRLINAAQNTYEADLFDTIARELPASTRRALDKLLEPDEPFANAADEMEEKRRALSSDILEVF